MNPKGKKFISLFLVLSLLSINCAYLNMSKERRGAELVVIKLDGRRIEGELIAVKQSSLLLADFPGIGVSVDVVDIEKIIIVHKSKAKIGGLSGALLGGTVGWVYGIRKAKQDPEDYSKYYGGIIGAVLFGVIGLIFGRIVGAVIGRDDVIRIEGRTDSEIRGTLDYLRKKARIRDYK